MLETLKKRLLTASAVNYDTTDPIANGVFKSMTSAPVTNGLNWISTQINLVACPT